MISIREVAMRTLSAPLVARVISTLRPQRGTIFYLHRFASASGNRRGHDSAILRNVLIALRAAKVQIVSIESLYAALKTGQPLHRPMVSFTVDDGYQDFIDVGIPLFAEFDCPATCFVVPGVIDGQTWFWWDQIDWIQRTSRLPSIDFELRGRPRRLSTGGSSSRQRDAAELIEALKLVSTDELRQTIAAIATSAEVDVSGTLPLEYAVATWDDLRRAERLGYSFGAHTMSHPILSRCTSEQSRSEILESIARVSAELTTPSRFFCYPNGGRDDFGAREMETVQSTGLEGAVSTEPAHIPLRDVAHMSAWKLPRFTHEEHIGVSARVVLIP